MWMNSTAVGLLSGISIALASQSALASACGKVLSSMSVVSYDLCSLSEEYQKVTAQLKSMGYSDPDRIADVIAPRFINFPEWEEKKGKKKINYNPWVVYCPAPKTWQSWENGNQLVTREARQDFERDEMSPISEQWIRDLWAVGVPPEQQDAGYRNQPGQGSESDQTDKDEALTPAQVAYVSKDLPFRNIVQSPVGASIIRWEPKGCDKDDKKCGIMHFPDGLEVPHQVRALAEEFNSWALTGADGFSTRDFLQAVARLQQWVISIHPFYNGNGRTSRLLMDRILMSVGLPAPVLRDQNLDLYLTASEWAKHIHEGLQLSVQIMKRCVADSSKPGCRQVSKEPPTSIPDVCSKE